MKKDYWQILGLKPGASEQEIRSTYKRLAKKYHPDLNPGDKRAEERFKEVSEAYEVLSDPQKRKQWERGEIDFEEFFRQRTRGGRTGDPFGFGFGGGVQEILEELFGGRAPGGMAGGAFGGARGSDLEFEASIDFLEAVSGSVLQVPLARTAACPDCGGRGGTARGGRCSRCGGRGGHRVNETLKVRIPAGVQDGARVRVPGKGEAGRGGDGDLYVRLKVRDHPWFRRDGDDILLDLPVTVAEASLGAAVEVPTLSGKVNLTIPPGTSSGRKLRLRGKGIAGRNGQPGDQIVVVQIVTPQKLDDRSKELIEELAELNPMNPRADRGW